MQTDRKNERNRNFNLSNISHYTLNPLNYILAQALLCLGLQA
jgi:hypothetical protein